jgi:hypothetical protein
MDAHFETITYTVINQFLDRVSMTSAVDKDTLWKVWKEMFSFPNAPVPKTIKKTVTESKEDESKPTETKPTETKPTETNPTETKPIESKPIESKPIESKPTETKPIETKPTETKPTETKPIESKPTETKPIETKPTDTKNEGCLYKFTRGDRTGQECGKKRKTDLFCTTHAK